MVSSALVVGGSCKTRGFQTASVRKPSGQGAYARWVKAQDSLVPVQETIQSENGKTDDAKSYQASKQSYKPQQGFEIREGVVDLRPELVALSQTDGLRDVLVSSVVAEQRRRSSQLKKAMRDDANKRVYDTIIVGAGPHGAALAQEFTDLDPSRRVLIIDGASRPGGTFAEVGPVFALNSTNRQDTGEQANVGQGQSGGDKGDGNLNAVADLLGIPDFSGLKWPLAGDLGYVTTIATEYSSADLLLNTRVVAVGSSGPGGAFVRVQDLNKPLVLPKQSGEDLTITARRVILATGIGKPSFFLPGKESVRQQLAAKATETQPPPLMLFGEFVKRVNDDLRNLRNPMAPYAGKRILVVGAGDSGKVVLEWLSGLGPDSRSYGGAQVGEPQEIVWAGVDFLSCKEFLEGARARYARIAQPINSALISLAPLRIKDIYVEENRGQFRISDFELKTKKDKDGQETFGPVSLSDADRSAIDDLVGKRRPFKTKGVNVGDLKEKNQTNADGTLNLQITDLYGVNFDYLIDATGFRTDTLALLQKGFPGQFREAGDLSRYFQAQSTVVNEGANKQLRGTERRYVAQLKDPESSLKPPLPIYLVGPANEQVAPLVDKDETARVSANTVSLFANIIRTKTLAQEITQAFPADNGPAVDLSRGTFKNQKPVIKINKTGQDTDIKLALLELPRAQGSYVVSPSTRDLEVALRKILSSFQLEGDLDKALLSNRLAIY
jgi:hypothetical protein